MHSSSYAHPLLDNMRQKAAVSTACKMMIMENERAALCYKMDRVDCTCDGESVTVFTICTSIIQFNHAVLESIKVTGES